MFVYNSSRWWNGNLRDLIFCRGQKLKKKKKKLLCQANALMWIGGIGTFAHAQHFHRISLFVLIYALHA